MILKSSDSLNGKQIDKFNNNEITSNSQRVTDGHTTERKKKNGSSIMKGDGGGERAEL